MDSRKVADCRRFPSEKGCSVTIAGPEDEVMEVAIQHAVASHGHQDTPELRQQLRGMLEDEKAAPRACPGRSLTAECGWKGPR